MEMSKKRKISSPIKSSLSINGEHPGGRQSIVLQDILTNNPMRRANRELTRTYHSYSEELDLYDQKPVPPKINSNFRANTVEHYEESGII